MIIEKSTLVFLKNLAENNQKEWFDANRKPYEKARGNFGDFVNALIGGMNDFDPTLSHLTAKDCMFRINRDIRFAKDKSPYKRNFAASINSGGKKSVTAGYYFHLEPGKSFIGGGIYMPMPEDLKKIRQEIDYCFEEFKSILKKKSFSSVYGDLDKTPEFTLVNPPKGYDKENPAIEYIKLKSFIAERAISDKEILSPDLLKKSISDFKAMKPMMDFLNRSFE